MGIRVCLVEAEGRGRSQLHMARFSLPRESRGTWGLVLAICGWCWPNFVPKNWLARNLRQDIFCPDDDDAEWGRPSKESPKQQIPRTLQREGSFSGG